MKTNNSFKVDTILSNIRKIRVESRVKQLTVALYLGISESFYSKIERGKKKLTLTEFLKICECLNVSPTNLFLDNYHLRDNNLSF